MPYRVLPDGSILADTAEEALALAKTIRAQAAGQAVGGSVTAPASGPLRGDAPLDPLETFVTVFRTLPSPQRKLLRLVKQYQALTLVMLQNMMLLGSNNAVTGVISGITKNLKRVGIDRDVVLRSGPVRHTLMFVPGYAVGPLLISAALPDEDACEPAGGEESP